jgi:hypothetical protein
MRAIHRADYRGPSGEIPLFSAIRNTFKRGNQWRRQLAAEDRVAAILARTLDDDYHLIRNLVLPDDRYDLDMVLVGPAGIWEFEVLPLVGLVHSEEGWVHWDYNQQGLRPVPLDLGQRARDKVTRLSRYLAERGLPDLDINQALVLASPNPPRDFSLPGVEVVFPDQLEHFMQAALNVLRSPTPVKDVVEQLSRAEGTEAESYEAERLWGMTPPQVLVILILAFLDVCLLATFLTAALIYSF